MCFLWQGKISFPTSKHMEATMKQKHKTRWWRSKKKSRHHIIPRSQGGQDNGNIVLLSENVHKAWHILFDDRTPEEAIEYLPRLLASWQLSANKGNKKWSRLSTLSRSRMSSSPSRFRSSVQPLSSSTCEVADDGSDGRSLPRPCDFGRNTDGGLSR